MSIKVAEVRVSYSLSEEVRSSKAIRSSKDVYDVLKEVFEECMDYQEKFVVLLLNRANKPLGYYVVSTGGVSSTIVDAKLVFSVALKALASSIILAHNHPSGNLRASQADIELGKKLKAGGKLLDIMVLDHLIITSRGYYSMADEGVF